ncbi:gluconate 5-dehydrogenase (plasmid) [Azospirillum sp. B510]|uniref:glucose 1-dehydrogenase n=1 Tax=Azospirillum sp. (strain B510) TaxID=137722 RepID=UPI0001C4C9AC|nr:glucose 1-dehydrogenase [Azospirillum sp. B510]BAI74694.1 gluconate 5-dehydrogenase [Azospirillum sp. B510]
MATDFSLFDLSGKRALVTGSGRGIGFALARGLAAAGAEIILNDIEESRVATAAEELRGAGHRTGYSVFDVTAHQDAADAVARVEETVGPIDILVNNAGIQRRAPLEEFKPEDWDAILKVNLSSVFHVSQAVARHMIPRGRGKIINICSVQSMLARPTIAPYAATKGAVAMFTKAQCTDWAKHGLQVNGIAPGYFATEMNKALVENDEFSSWLCRRTPAGRWGKVEELVGAAVFLSSAAADFVNGQVLYVDGGLTSCV